MENNQQQKPVNWEALYISATRDITQLQHAVRLMEMELNQLKGISDDEENAADLPGETIIENGKDKPESKPS